MPWWEFWKPKPKELPKPRWDQESITQWATDTFGWNSPLSIGIRLNREMSELLSALEHEQTREAIKECADIQIMVCQIAERLRADLDREVQVKMDINANRQWRKNKNGSYQHIGTGSDSAEGGGE